MAAPSDQPGPCIAVSMGDPGGIGPEVLAAALRGGAAEGARVVIYGPARAMGDQRWPVVHALDDVPVDAAVAVCQLDDADIADDGAPFERAATARGGAISHRQVLHAIDATKLPAGHPARADASCTAPISKAAWVAAGLAEHPGHTELLAQRLGAPRYAMAFVSQPLLVALATAHVPLRRVPEVLTTARVAEVIELAGKLCKDLGIDKPRIVVAGLNPHAGEGGALGDEDDAIIAPAVAEAQDRGFEVTGPLPGDTVFRDARRPGGEFDIVVAMYHDQALAPLKLVAFDHAVNITLGLGVPRTSPDHGTAFGIAGRGVADAGSMAAALQLAARLASNRSASTS
ncbi:MAG: 4-hydroxythreonine-4-phosphate dehydrogenase PdxA [Phycisphaerales bacterium]